MAFVGKVYAHEKDENFAEFVDTLGPQAEKLKTWRPKQKLEKDGDSFKHVVIGDTETTEIAFKIGQEFDETVAPGRVSKTVFTLDGNTLTQVQKFEDGLAITTKREYSDEKLIVTITTNKWDGSAVRYYKA
ncbi:fatty acid-binding protein 1-like isoform X2 [Battus philenor]|uniref:fatty acid-binding protein 1-like isoform X2 n=1 Tax=Battus philenor TaxID=42288 RepID=UPI0035D0A3A5